jgi:hypothetical protein
MCASAPGCECVCNGPRGYVGKQLLLHCSQAMCRAQGCMSFATSHHQQPLKLETCHNLVTNMQTLPPSPPPGCEGVCAGAQACVRWQHLHRPGGSGAHLPAHGTAGAARLQVSGNMLLLVPVGFASTACSTLHHSVCIKWVGPGSPTCACPAAAAAGSAMEAIWCEPGKRSPLRLVGTTYLLGICLMQLQVPPCVG